MQAHEIRSRKAESGTIRARTIIGAGLAAALATAFVLLPATGAVAAAEDRATGGGQVLIGTRGAGDTIAFTARGAITAADGQVQYVDRTGGTGQGQTTYHGSVACLDVVGNVARIAGTWRDGGNFQIYVEDNGEGVAADNDVVTLMNFSDEPTCDFDEPEESDKVALARGNAQVHDA